MLQRIVHSSAFLAFLFTSSLTCQSTEAAESIAYRLPEWHEQHFEDPAKAELHLQTVKNLKCEAKKVDDAGHEDIVYLAPKWQSLELATDELAHQWADWLQVAGFEMVHGHSAEHEDHKHGEHGDQDHAKGEMEEVTYRLPEWKTTHFEESNRFNEYVALMKGFGCELRTEDHEGHGDMNVRCQKWKHIELATHTQAVVWEEWLKKAGFEVQHSHA